MARSTAIHDRVAEAILDAAADLLARGGEPPTMNEVAAAAGVGRATLYRHFPTREQLLQALSITVRDATATRLAEADLDAVPVTEAIARVARVVAAGGSKYAALISRFGVSDYGGDAEQQIGTLLRALLQRGLDDGTFRADLTVEELLFLLGQLLQAAARMTAEHVAGVEKAAALVTSVFLHGTERRQDATADDRADLPTVAGSPATHGGSGPGRSCCPGAHRIRRRNAREVEMRRGLRRGQRDRARARRRLRLAWLAVTRPAAPAAVDEQAVNGIWHAVQGRTHGWQAAERLPPFLIVKADLEHHAPAVRMPRPVDGAVRQRGLDQCRVVLLLPPESRKLTVQDLDRPPFSHQVDGTTCSWIPASYRG